jgi:ADP-ribose diphosphatase
MIVDIDMLIKIISTSAAVGMLSLIWRQLHLQTKQSKFDALTKVHEQVMSTAFREALLAIFSTPPEVLADVKSKDLLEKLGLVTGLYDLVGARIEEGVLPYKPTLKTEWKILITLWQQVEQFIIRERERRCLPYYKEHLERLVNKAKEYRDKEHPDCNPKVINRKSILENSNSEPHTPEEPNLVCNGKHLNFYRKDISWEYVSRKRATGGVIILAVTDSDEILLVEQYRVPLQKNVIELPAGLVGDEAILEGEDFQIAAKRELLEETGYVCKKLTRLCQGPVLPGLTDEINVLFLAEGLVKSDGMELSETEIGGVIAQTKLGDLTAGEAVTLYRIPLQNVGHWLKGQTLQGKLIDLKIYIGLFFLMNQRDNLGHIEG